MLPIVITASPLGTIIIVLIVVGIALLLIMRFVPMESRIKTILLWVVVIAVLIWLCHEFGVLEYINKIK